MFRRYLRRRRGRGRPRSNGTQAAKIWRDVAECEKQLGPRSRNRAVLIVAEQRHL